MEKALFIIWRKGHNFLMLCWCKVAGNLILSQCKNLSEPCQTSNFGKKPKGWISKRVLQENKARQIFQKTNNSYSLMRTRTSDLKFDFIWFEISDLKFVILSCYWWKIRLFAKKINDLTWRYFCKRLNLNSIFCKRFHLRCLIGFLINAWN